MGYEAPKHREVNQEDASKSLETFEAKKEREIESIKEKSLPLTALGLKMPEVSTSIDQNINAAPNTWIENSGVMVWIDRNGRKYATPSSDESRRVLNEHFKKDTTNIGVPNLNNKDLWGDNPEEKSKSFLEWQRLVGRISSIQ